MEIEMGKIKFFRTMGATRFCVGVARETPNGWRFTSNVCSHKGSRKTHPTAKACIPRWVKDCEMVVIEAE